MTDETNLPAIPKPQIRTGATVAALVPSTLDEAYRLADAMSRSGMTPATIKTPEAVMVAIMAGAELGFPPFQAVQSFAVINGRPSIWGDAIPALLLSNGFGLKEWFDNSDPAYPDNMTAKCEITRPDGQITLGEFSVADAKEALLWSKSGPWQTAKKRMLKMRARSFAARDGAADLLRGLFVAEEAQDFTPIADVTTGTGMAARLAARAQDVDAAGFNVRTVTETTEEARPTKPRAQRAGKKKTAGEVAEPASDAGTETEVGSAGTGATIGQTTGAELTSPDASDAQPHHEVAEKAEAALEQAEPPNTVVSPNISEGFPLPGETYHVASALNFKPEDGKRDTFKDGEFFSRAGGKAGNRVYADHAPKAEAEPEPEIQDAEFTAGIDASDEITVQPGHAEAGEDYFLDEEDGEDGLWPVYRDGVEIGRGDGDTHPDVVVYAMHAPKVAKTAEPNTDSSRDFSVYYDAVRAATRWDQIKAELAEFRKTPAFESADKADQRKARLAAYTAADTLRAAGKDGVTIHTDPSFFVLYLLQADPKNVRSDFARLVRSPAYQALNDDAKEGVCAQVDQVAGG